MPAKDPANSGEWTETSADGEWTDVETENQIVFDTIGDVFIGTFQGWSETESGIPQAHFVNEEGTFFTNCGWDMKNKMKNIRKGWTVRLELTGHLDTGRDTPMNVFKVQYKK